MKILAIEDDRLLIAALGAALASRGITLHNAHSQESAISAITRELPDVILLDLGLPDGDGLKLIPHLAATVDVPIIVISARRDTRDKVLALSAGADDYLAKPFAVDELIARIHAVRRRTGIESLHRVWKVGSLILTPSKYQCVRADGLEIHFTRLEWSILEALLMKSNEVVSTDSILLLLWGEGRGDLSRLRVHIAHIRQKLGPDGIHLSTESRIGYRFRAQSA